MLDTQITTIYEEKLLILDRLSIITATTLLK